MPIKKHSQAVRRKQNRAADKARGSARERGYSTEWDKFSAGWLEGHPLCQYCFNQGRVSPAELTDHIVPHRGDRDRFWPDDGVIYEEFFAACCKECHDGAKQRAEAMSLRTGKDVRAILCKWGMLPPDFPGADPDARIANAGAVVITGPPAVGKTTLALQNQQTYGGRIYDLDDIAEELELPRYGRTHEQAKRALLERDIRLVSHPARERLILVVPAPTAKERLYWQDRVNGNAIALMEPREELVKRIRKRTRDTKEFATQIEALNMWIAKADV